MCTITQTEIDAAEAYRLERERREAEAKASHAIINAKRPDWAQALIVAELHEDDSDSMSDYFAHKRTRTVAIGWRKGKREDFRQLRAAAAKFPETVHLGPGHDEFTVYTLTDRGMCRDSFKFTTEAEANAKADELRADGETVSVRRESVEHRENYSMGGGNYLKYGSRHGSGWCVKSESLSGWGSTVIEDCLPESAAPVKTPPKAKRESNTVRRDTVRKLAEAGRLVLVESYHYDEMTGESRGTEEIPVAMYSGQFRQGVCQLRDHDFTSSSGRAYLNKDCTITLYVHSNCNYTFRILDQAPASVQSDPLPAQESAPLAIYTPEPSEPVALTVVSPEVESEAVEPEQPEEPQTERPLSFFEQRRAIRIARYRQKAAAARREASARFNSTNNEILRGMMGEPIKVGHHSERRHRALIARAHRDMDKGCEAMSKAEHYERRADAAESNNAISSDDPEALPKLREKLAELEARQERMKAVNAAHKRFLKDPASLANSGLSDELQERIRTYQPQYSWEPHPYPPYATQNNNANIKRVRDRIGHLERLEAERSESSGPTTTRETEAYRIEEHPDDNRLWFVFPGKPSKGVCQLMRRNGFKWSPDRKAWVRQLHSSTRRIAEYVAKQIDDTPLM